jgi:large subunit ribosomal protein L13
MNKTTKVTAHARGEVGENAPSTIEQVVDVKGQKVGRVASQIAALLLGKNSRTFTKHLTADVRVVVQNVDSLDIPANRLAEKKYARYSGYPGGLRMQSVENLIEKKGKSEVLREAVSRMLPRNTLRTPRMKNLTFSK